MLVVSGAALRVGDGKPSCSDGVGSESDLVATRGGSFNPVLSAAPVAVLVASVFEEAAGSAGRVLSVHASPSHHRCPPCVLPSGYQPGSATVRGRGAVRSVHVVPSHQRSTAFVTWSSYQPGALS